MSQRAMDHAEELIRQRRYAEANALLNQVGRNRRSEKLMARIQRETGQRKAGMGWVSKLMIGCGGLVGICMICVVGSFIGQEAGILPDFRETETAEAIEKTQIKHETEILVALRANDTTTTAQNRQARTPTPTPTLTPTSTQSPADRAAQVVRNLRDTDISDNDLRESTSDFPDVAVLRIYLRNSDVRRNKDEKAIEQARKDFKRLVCDLRKAGFTRRIAITGLVEIDGEEQKAVEIVLEADTIADIPCDRLGEVDILAIADSLYIHPSFDVPPGLMPTPTSRPTTRITPRATTRSNSTSETRYTTENINVRRGPGTNFDRVGSLPAGAAIEVIGEQGGWYEIEFAGETGWVFGEYTTATRPSAPQSTRPPASNNPPTNQPSEVCSCAGDLYNCSNFSSQAAAQSCFNYCMSAVGYDVHRLDQGGQPGVVCESLP